MKKYNTPKIEITEFQYEDITNGNTSFIPVNLSVENDLKISKTA